MDSPAVLSAHLPNEQIVQDEPRGGELARAESDQPNSGSHAPVQMSALGASLFDGHVAVLLACRAEVFDRR